MKIILNPMFDQATGQLGEIVFRRVRGKTIAGRGPSGTAEPSEAQAQHRERFKRAAAYGKAVMADSSLRAVYQALADSKDMPVFAATVADFLSLPVIQSIDLADYHGNTGDLIHIDASDEFGGVTVRVSLLDAAGLTLEAGPAVEALAGSGQWSYAGKATYAANTPLTIKVVATDRPGVSAEAAQSKTI